MSVAVLRPTSPRGLYTQRLRSGSMAFLPVLDEIGTQPFGQAPLASRQISPTARSPGLGVRSPRPSFAPRMASVNVPQIPSGSTSISIVAPQAACGSIVAPQAACGSIVAPQAACGNTGVNGSLESEAKKWDGVLMAAKGQGSPRPNFAPQIPPISIGRSVATQATSVDAGMESALMAAKAQGKTALCIWFHYLGGSSADWEEGLKAKVAHELPSVAWYFPEAPVQPISYLGGLGQRCWFDQLQEHVTENMATPGLEASVSRVHGCLRQAEAHGFPSNRIILGGMSQGGVLAMAAGFSYENPLAGIIAASAWVPPCLSGMIRQPNTPIMMGIGDQDKIVRISLFQSSARKLELAGCSRITKKMYPGMQHRWGVRECQDVKQFITSVIPTNSISSGTNANILSATPSTGFLAPSPTNNKEFNGGYTDMNISTVSASNEFLAPTPSNNTEINGGYAVNRARTLSSGSRKFKFPNDVGDWQNLKPDPKPFIRSRSSGVCGRGTAMVDFSGHYRDQWRHHRDITQSGGTGYCDAGWAYTVQGDVAVIIGQKITGKFRDPNNQMTIDWSNGVTYTRELARQF